MRQKLDKSFVSKCREKLVHIKAELMNRLRDRTQELTQLGPYSGDEVDQLNQLIDEQNVLTHHARIRLQISEIESALARIEKGLFGICEETDEPIEVERLQLIPWTRLSIEGAEIRDSFRRHSSKMN